MSSRPLATTVAPHPPSLRVQGLELTHFDGGALVTHRLRVAPGPTTLRTGPGDGAVQLVTPEPALVAAALAGVVGLHRSHRGVEAEPVAAAPALLRRFLTLLATDQQPAAAALLDHPSLGASGLRALLDLAAGQASAWWLEPGSLTVLDGGAGGRWAGVEGDGELQPVTSSALWCRLVAAAGPSPTR